MDPVKAAVSLYLDFVFLCVDKMYHIHHAPVCLPLGIIHLMTHSPHAGVSSQRSLKQQRGNCNTLTVLFEGPLPPWGALPYSMMGIFPGAFSCLAQGAW